MLLKNQWVNAEIKKNILKYLETNDNENTTIQNPWNAARAVLRGKFIAIQTFLKEKKGKISNKPPNIPPKRITQQNLKSRVFWKGKQNWQISGQAHQNEKEREPK